MSEVAKTRMATPALRRALEQALGRRVKSVHRRPSPYASSYTIEELDVTLATGATLHLILKDLSRGAMLANAAEIRPKFLHRPAREIEVYGKWLNPDRHGTARCHGAISETATSRHWLILERIDGSHLWQTGEMSAWHNAARWLARLHAEFAKPPAAGRHLLRYNRGYFARWPARAERFMEKRGGNHPAELRRHFQKLLDRYDGVIHNLSAMKKTLVHGEFYPSNIIIRAGGRGGAVCPIDWEVAGIGPGAIDLAALTSGRWSLAEKRKFLSAYRDEGGGARLSSRELLEAVELAQLHLCVQMMGWAADWSPPDQHAQNWLCTALRLAEKRGLL